MSVIQGESWSESSILLVSKELQKSEIYHELLNKLQDLITDPDITADTLEEKMRTLIRESGYKQKLRNLVYQYINKNSHLKCNVKQKKEPLDFVQKAQANWERRIIKSLNNMCNELGIAFSRKRPVSEQKEFEAKWSELGTEDMALCGSSDTYLTDKSRIRYGDSSCFELEIQILTNHGVFIFDKDLSRFRPVYSPKDFLEVLINVRSPNVSPNLVPDLGVATIWGQIKVPLKVKDFQTVRREFEELSGNIGHLGIDIHPFSKGDASSNFLKDRVTLGKQVLEANHAPVSREYCKRGCPPTLRAEMWALMLGVDTCNADKLNFQHLKSCVFQHDLMIDKLIFKDIHLTASNDDQYFVFEDLLYQIILVFSRDTSVSSHFDKSSASPPKAVLRGPHTQDNVTVIYPPNGVIPFHGFSMYVAPLCYIYEDPITLYFIFRELYCRYFFRLHNLSSHSQGILSLCLMFETLLHELEPQVAYHFACHDIQPLKVVVKWLIRAFSGYLATDQILQLWDCILAYDSNEILPVLAIAIISLRKGILLQAETQSMAEGMLADISGIKVIPLLHGMLCAARNNGTGFGSSSR